MPDPLVCAPSGCGAGGADAFSALPPTRGRGGGSLGRLRLTRANVGSTKLLEDSSSFPSPTHSSSSSTMASGGAAAAPVADAEKSTSRTTLAAPPPAATTCRASESAALLDLCALAPARCADSPGTGAGTGNANSPAPPAPAISAELLGADEFEELFAALTAPAAGPRSIIIDGSGEVAAQAPSIAGRLPPSAKAAAPPPISCAWSIGDSTAVRCAGGGRGWRTDSRAAAASVPAPPGRSYRKLLSAFAFVERSGRPSRRGLLWSFGVSGGLT